MYELHLGEIITRYRYNYNINQDRLCYGICNPNAFSRIETYSKMTDAFLTNHLLERMGIYEDKIIVLLNDKTFELYEMVLDIKNYLKEKNHEAANQLLECYEKLINECPNIHYQFILKCKGEIAKQKGNLSEALDLFKTALYKTLPNFDNLKMQNYYFNSQELELILECETTKAAIYNRQINIDLLEKIVRGAHWLHPKELSYNEAYPKLILSCCKYYYDNEMYKQCRNTAKRCIRALFFTNNPSIRAEIFYYNALSTLEIFNRESCKNDFLCAYYMADILDQREFASEIENKLREVYGWKSIEEAEL